MACEWAHAKAEERTLQPGDKHQNKVKKSRYAHDAVDTISRKELGGRA